MTSGKELIPLSNNTLAQLAHVGWGALFVYTFAAFGHPWIGLLVTFIGVTGKEFVYDYVWEDAATRGSSLEDWAFWLVGMAFAALIVK